MMTRLKTLFKKPTPLERAARELGQIEHAILDLHAEIEWGRKQLEYYEDRKTLLRDYVTENCNAPG